MNYPNSQGPKCKNNLVLCLKSVKESSRGLGAENREEMKVKSLQNPFFSFKTESVWQFLCNHDFVYQNRSKSGYFQLTIFLIHQGIIIWKLNVHRYYRKFQNPSNSGASVLEPKFCPLFWSCVVFVFFLDFHQGIVPYIIFLYVYIHVISCVSRFGKVWSCVEFSKNHGVKPPVCSVELRTASVLRLFS